MMKCKWAGDVADEYCKSCDGIKMMVDGIEKSCSECAGYEARTEEVDAEEEVIEEVVEEVVEPTKIDDKPAKKSKTNKSTSSDKKSVKNEDKQVVEGNKTEDETVTKEKSYKIVNTDVKAEEDIIETEQGIKVIGLRYTSGATIKKGDNYYKFVAEEEWNLTEFKGDVDTARDMLWAKLNNEVDKQIDELNSIN